MSGFYQDCQFCKTQFRAEELESICDHCKGVLSNALTKSQKLRRAVAEYLMQDSDFIKNIAKEIFDIPAVEIGLGGPGTIAQFFRRKRKKSSKETSE